MSEHDNSKDSGATPGSGGKQNGRKPYRRPEVVSSEHMEIVAAVCTAPGKSNFGECPTGPINS